MREAGLLFCALNASNPKPRSRAVEGSGIGAIDQTPGLLRICALESRLVDDVLHAENKEADFGNVLERECHFTSSSAVTLPVVVVSSSKEQKLHPA